MTEDEMHSWLDDVGPGWRDIVRPLIIQANKDGAQIFQIKEKFGGLRFYVDGGSKELSKMIDAAEVLSFKTCEQCGAPGELRTDLRWLKTCCDEHHQQRLARQTANFPTLKEPT